MAKKGFFRTTAVLWLTVLAINGYGQNREASKGWKEVRICNLSILMPKEMKNKKARGIDSCVASFRSKNLGLGMDYGENTATPEQDPDYLRSKTEFLEIDGKKAVLSTVWYQSRLYILVAQSEYYKTALGLTISGKNQADLDTARQIFKSIIFIEK